jgi:hypothetical protein
VEQVEIERLVGELEVGLDRLRSLYDQYFMGIERIEPAVPKKDVDRRIYVLRREQIRNTGLRFRFQMLLQRYNTFQSHWQRICREIEGGTYKRHVMRAQARFGETGTGPMAAAARRAAARAAVPEPGAPVQRDLAAELAELDAEFAPAVLDDIDVDVVLDEPAPPRRAGPPPPPPTRHSHAPSLPRQSQLPALPGPSQLPADRPSQPQPVWRKAEVSAPRAQTAQPATAPRTDARPAAPASPPASAPRTAVAAPVRPAIPPARDADDLPEERVRQLYAQYVDTKRRQNESTAAITYDAVAKSLRDSSAKLREKHGKAVDFEVRVKDGKTILKPVVK